MLEDDIEIEANNIVHIFTSNLGNMFSPWEAAEFVALTRNRRLVVIERTIDNAHFGLVFSLIDFDLIIIVPSLGYTLFLLVFFHELTHILKGDAPTYQRTYDQFIHGNILRELIALQPMCCASDSFYDNMSPGDRLKERIASKAASFLVKHAHQYKYTTPRTSMLMFGHGNVGDYHE